MVSVIMGDPTDPHGRGVYPGKSGSSGGRRSPETGTTEFEVDLEGMTPEQAREWLDMQIPYPNLADDPEIAARAVEFVKKVKGRWEDGTVETREKWRAMQFMLRGGNTLAERFEQTDLHVPELYKLIEQLVPRIEEALITGHDPFFAVIGRRKMTKLVAHKIAAFLASQLRQDNFDQKIQPSIRSMLEYSFSGFKIFWDIEIAKRIVKNVERLPSKDGKTRYKMTREEREEVVWNGPRVRMLDPLDMIVDLRSVLPPHDALYVGDQWWATIEELRAYEKLGLYKNVDLVEKDSEQIPEAGYRDFDKQSRSLERYNYRERELWVKGAPRRVRMTELWCMYDPMGGDQASPQLLTIANDRVALRVQENFHDDKHVPYAIGRVSREGYEFLNVGPLDHGLSIQISIDNNRNLVLKGHENHLCPQVFARDTSGFPDNFFDVAPGSVWQSQEPPTFLQSPSTLADYRHMYEIERRDLEEIVGSPRIWEATSGGEKTATGIERKVQEGNRRLRGYVLSYSFMLRSVLEQMHSLNKQFVTRDMTFRVLGKAARDLGQYTQIGPNDLKHEIDFEFAGLGALRTLDLRATQIQTFMSTMYPYMQMHPGVVDVPEILREAWEAMVGTKPADEIIKDPGSMDDMLPQDEENYMLVIGEQVKVHPMDDDLLHLEAMEADFPDLRDHNKLVVKHGEDAARVIAAHYQEHLLAYKQKQLRGKAEENYIPPIPQQSQYDAGRGTTGNRREAGMLPFGADTGGAPAVTPPGETPGPPAGGRVGAGDRRQGFFQTQNLSPTGS